MSTDATDTSEPLNGSKPQPDPIAARLKNALAAFHPAYASTVVMPGREGLMVQFDPLDLLVQGQLDRITFQVLLDLLVDAGDIDKAEFYELLGAAIERHTARLTKGSGPRLVVPR